MYSVYLRKHSGEVRTYTDIVTISGSRGRVLLTFKDGSIIKFNPGDIFEMRITVNYRRMIYETEESI